MYSNDIQLCHSRFTSRHLVRVPTLIYLINTQDGINEKEDILSRIITQAGWNKRAGRANFEAIVNKQGGQRPKTYKITLGIQHKTDVYSVYYEISQHSLKFLQILIEI